MNILFIGHSHRVNDPRLLHREMKLLKENISDVTIWVLKYASVSKPKIEKSMKPIVEVKKTNYSGVTVNILTIKDNRLSPFRLFGLFQNNSGLIKLLIQFLKDTKIDFIQASDVREIAFATELAKKTKSILIYDSHEDYIRQAIDYGRNIFEKYLWAIIFQYLELKYVRIFDYIFCTDKFLVQKYSNRIYSARNIRLLRNFPLVRKKEYLKRKYKDKSILKLVYIGSINRYRGLIETAKYVNKFNTAHQNLSLEFTIYSTENQLVEDLIEKYGITHRTWIDYSELKSELMKFDVGICLWLPIKKYYRNLPLKNFDYMSSGLPIITSNFGNLTRYIKLSKAGVCINPKSYDEFENAILRMFDGKTRQKLGLNGYNWVKDTANFYIEGKGYLEVFEKFNHEDLTSKIS